VQIQAISPVAGFSLPHSLDVKTYSSKAGLVPPEHVLVFDEAFCDLTALRCILTS